jgi:hypothetical protein
MVLFGAFLLVAAIYVLAPAGKTEACTVCVSYRGNRSCGNATGRTPDEAVQEALRRSCATLAPSDSQAPCIVTPPAVIQCEA